ncbi:hypothetical protein ACFPMF_15270 [Larkinella bovis]|uniref:Uncharacterized protein n=1 Tax=Larkinella bovis TaxID=683041 RepID=A0ABW0IEY9_9BACT
MIRQELIQAYFDIHDVLFKLVSTTDKALRPQGPRSQIEEHGDGLMQKALLHATTIRRSLDKGYYYSKLEERLIEYQLDSITTMTTIRSMYEAMLTFNHIYINPPTLEEVQMRFWLWVISSAISKKGLTPDVFSPDTEDTKDVDYQLQKIVELLRNSRIFSTLGQKSQQILQNKLCATPSGKWEYFIANGDLQWAEGIKGLVSRLTVRPKIFDNIYKVLSLDTHATFESINNMLYPDRLPPSSDTSNSDDRDGVITLAMIVLVLLIHDYCTFFKGVRQTFNQLPEKYKLTVNNFIEQVKGPEFQL